VTTGLENLFEIGDEIGEGASVADPDNTAAAASSADQSAGVNAEETVRKRKGRFLHAVILSSWWVGSNIIFQDCCFMICFYNLFFVLVLILLSLSTFIALQVLPSPTVVRGSRTRWNRQAR
jgi:hypothetical protein